MSKECPSSSEFNVNNPTEGEVRVAYSNLQLRNAGAAEAILRDLNVFNPKKKVDRGWMMKIIRDASQKNCEGGQTPQQTAKKVIKWTKVVPKRRPDNPIQNSPNSPMKGPKLNKVPIPIQVMSGIKRVLQNKPYNITLRGMQENLIKDTLRSMVVKDKKMNMHQAMAKLIRGIARTHSVNPVDNKSLPGVLSSIMGNNRVVKSSVAPRRRQPKTSGRNSHFKRNQS